jgi:nanoRNase/pAp phosphatase (c-di-AMP/oligoRNAs hydrolase)
VKKLGFFKRRKFKGILKNSNRELTILVRKDPTPDSLASALALKQIADYFHINSKCYYSGIVHNKALLNIMGADIEHLPDVITDEISETVALVDVVPSELPHGLATLIETPAIIISHSKATTKDIKSRYKDIRSNVETTSTIMVQYMRDLNVPLDSTVSTLLLFAIRDRTGTFLFNLNRQGLEAYLYILEFVDHDLLNKLENPPVKSETFNDLEKALTNRTIKDTYLLTNTGYIKDPSTLPKVCKYMLDLEGISTSLVYAVNTSKIYAYAASNNIEVNLKQIFKKAFGNCGNIVGEASYASTTIPLGVFGTITEGINNIESKELMFKTIGESISSRFFRTIEEGTGDQENK